MSERVEFPIRLILGGAKGVELTDKTITIVYEMTAGKANMQTFFELEKFRFVDAGEPSVIVLDVTKSKSLFGGGENVKSEVVEVRIRRDWQFKS